MKKVFIIISSITMSLILIMILVMSLIKVNVKLEIDDNPTNIFVYNQSTAAFRNNNDGEGYKSKDKEYKEILNYLNDMTNISVFTRLMNGISLNSKPEQDLDGTYVSYASELKTTHIAIELLYLGDRDAIVYYKGNAKTISFCSIIFFIPLDRDLSDVAIYFGGINSLTTTSRENSYRNCVPINVKAKTKNIANYIKNLTTVNQ